MKVKLFCRQFFCVSDLDHIRGRQHCSCVVRSISVWQGQSHTSVSLYAISLSSSYLLPLSFTLHASANTMQRVGGGGYNRGWERGKEEKNKETENRVMGEDVLWLRRVYWSLLHDGLRGRLSLWQPKTNGASDGQLCGRADRLEGTKQHKKTAKRLNRFWGRGILAKSSAPH